MTSILTNNAATAALDTLRSISKSLDTTQSRISSGYRVANASDNAAYWSIATTMRSDNKALSTVQDALGLGAAKTDTAYTGMEAAIGVVTEIKAKLVAAREPGVDKDKIQKELAELKSQLGSIAESASFSGENWLFNESTTAVGTKEMVGSFVRAADGTVSVELLSFDAASSLLIDTKNATKGLLTKDYAVKVDNGTTGGTMMTYYLIKDTGTGASGEMVRRLPKAPGSQGRPIFRSAQPGTPPHAIEMWRSASHRQGCSGTGSWSVSFDPIRPPLAIVFKRV